MELERHHPGMSSACTCTDALTRLPYPPSGLQSYQCFGEHADVDGKFRVAGGGDEVAWTVAWRRKILPSACC